MKLLARLGIAVLASLAFLGVAPVAAYAGAASIVDNANVLDSGDIETAAGKVDKVNFIVVTLKSSSTNVESDVQSLGTRAGWNGDDWRADSVIIAVNTQSLRSAVFYGVSTPEKIQNASTAEDIRSSMSSDFGNSQWTAGVVAGIEKVQSIVSPSYTWVWFLAVIALLVIGWLVYRSFKSRRAKQEAKLAQDQLAAANQLTAVQLRQRVDELGVLIQTVPDGPTRDPIEAELTDVDVTLRRREERSGFDSTGVGATAEQDQQNLATLQAHVDNITNTLAILRKDPGWQDLWNASVAAARQQTDTLERGQQQVAGIDGFAPMDIAPLKTQLHAMASSVMEGTMPVGDGLAILQSVISALSNKQAEVDARLQAIDREERAKEEHERAAQDQRDSDDMSGGLGGGGIGGGWLGGGGRSGGGGFGRRGGGSSGGFGGGGRSGGGGFGRRGGGSSGGFGGGGSSGGFGGGGRRGGGSSGGF